MPFNYRDNRQSRINSVHHLLLGSPLPHEVKLKIPYKELVQQHGGVISDKMFKQCVQIFSMGMMSEIPWKILQSEKHEYWDIMNTCEIEEFEKVTETYDDGSEWTETFYRVINRHDAYFSEEFDRECDAEECQQEHGYPNLFNEFPWGLRQAYYADDVITEDDLIDTGFYVAYYNNGNGLVRIVGHGPTGGSDEEPYFGQLMARVFQRIGGVILTEKGWAHVVIDEVENEDQAE